MPYRSALASFVAISCLVACSSAPPIDEPLTSTSSQPLPLAPLEACPVARAQLVLRFALGPSAPDCPAVEGRGGTWEYVGPSKIETCVATEAPERGEPYLCKFLWRASARPADAIPDVGALDALEGAYVAPASGGGATCDDDSLLPYGTLLQRAGVRCYGANGGPNGPHECDVCDAPLLPGVVEGSLWIPASSPIRTVVLHASSGASQVLTIGSTARPDAAARPPEGTVRIALPRLPRGTSWVEGPVLGYGYTH